VTVAVCERVPLVPVIVTTSVPAAVNVQDRVEVPDPVTLVGLNEQAVLLAVRLTTPVKPFWAVMVIVDVPATPVLTETVVGLEAMEKSDAAGPTTTVRVALFFTLVPDVALMAV
jgi:hypothetical protein